MILDRLKKQIRVMLYFSKIQNVAFLVFILLLNIFLETFSLGLIIPLLNSFVNPDFFTNIQNLEFYFDIKNFLFLLNVSNSKDLTILLSITFLIFFLLRIITNILCVWFLGKFKFSLHKELSNKIMRGYLSLPYLELKNKNSAKSINNLTNETDILSSNILVMIQVISEIFLIFALFSLLVFTEPLITLLIVIIFGTIGIFLNYITSIKLKVYGEARQNYAKETNKNIIEFFKLIKEIKIFERTNFFYKKFSNTYSKLIKIFWYKSVFPVIPRAVFEVIAITALILAFTYNLTNNLDINNFIISASLFIAIGYRLLPSVNKLLNHIQSLVFGKAASDLVFRELDKIRSSQQSIKKENSDQNLIFKREIVFKDLMFSYADKDKPAIKNLSFSINKGQFFGIKGSSGSGKTTLIKILTGLINYESGQILIDGQILNLNNMSKWKKKIGYVSQEVALLDDTIKNNIAFGYDENEIDLNKISSICKNVEMEDLIKSLPKGLDTFIGESGNLISGGQAQRIAIARALYREPEILILDESTNSLDEKTEKKIITAIKTNLKKLTVIIISHRKSTIEFCDKTISI